MSGRDDDSKLVRFWLEQQRRERRSFRRRRWVLNEARRLSHDNDCVLNLGCGVGSYSFFLKENIDKIKIVSLDISYNCLKTGIENYHIDSPVMANALYIPLKEKSFDLIIFSEVIEHITEQEQLIKEISRVIKNGGYTVLTTSPLKSDLLYKLVQKIKKEGLLGLHVEKEHVAVQHPYDIIKNMERADFIIIKQKFWNVFHLCSIQWLMKIPVVNTAIEKIDDRLWFLWRFCTDYACVAKKLEDTGGHISRG